MIKELLIEYFDLKDQDKTIRKIRNEFMSKNHCKREDAQMEGECIGRTYGMAGYPIEYCDVCKQRNEWYLQRMEMSRRRGQIMRKIKRLVMS